jgi:hypothetical protein
VTWGDAVLEQPLTMAAGAHRTLDLLLRTADPDSTVRVALDAGGGINVQTRDLPVTVLPPDAEVILCVAGIDDEVPPSPACSTTITPAQLPTSARAYDSVDRVVTAEGMRVPQDARTALQQWQSLRALDLAGDLSLTPQPTRPVVPRGMPAGLSNAFASVFGTYAIALALVGLVAASMGRAAWSPWAGFALVLVLGTAASVAVGRVGAGSEIVVHHSSLLQQIPGTQASALMMRGVAEFPADGEISLSVPTHDGILETTQARGRAPHVQDESGQPLLRSVHGLGARQAFTTEAIVQLQWASVTMRDNVIHVQNVAPHVLQQCRFADGITPTDVGDLAPGARVTAVRHDDYGGPLMTCVAAIPVLPMRSAERPATMRGITRLAVYSPRSGATHAEGAPND